MLTYDRNEKKMGYCIYENGCKCDIYKGNAYMICVYRNDDGEDELSWFLIGKDHFKNMLGLGKGFPGNDFAGFGIKTLGLNLSFKDVPEIVQLLAKAKTQIRLELYND